MTGKEALKKICDNVNAYYIEFNDETELKHLVDIIKKDLEKLEMYECYFKPDYTYIYKDREDGEIQFEFSGTDFILYVDKNDTYYDRLLELAKDIDNKPKNW